MASILDQPSLFFGEPVPRAAHWLPRSQRPGALAGGTGLTAATSLADIARLRAEATPDRVAFERLTTSQERESPQRSYAELDARARSIAARLQQARARGETVLVLLPPGLDFVDAIFGCLDAGAVAVPAALPTQRRQSARLRAIADDCAPHVVLCNEATLHNQRAISQLAPSLARAQWLSTAKRNPGSRESFHETSTHEDELCMIQYTSGSTGEVKGVMLTHKNMLANLHSIERTFGLDPLRDRGLSWLPPYHDMGLVGGILAPVYTGVTTTLCSPEWLVRRPERWLTTIAERRITVSGGPNSAYERCCERAEKVPEHTDLSCWRVAFNGSEPVQPDTLRRFAQTFARHRFSPAALLPTYGLAEATLLVAASSRGDQQPSDTSGTPQYNLVAHGHELLVVDPERREPCAQGEIGEIWLAGPSVAAGYFARPYLSQCRFRAELTRDTSGSPRFQYLRTGDLGRCGPEGVYVLGRLDDAVLVHERLVCAETLEWSIRNSHRLLEGHAAVAFSIAPSNATRRLVIVQELGRSADRATATAAVQHVLHTEHDVHADEVIFVPPRGLPRTSSGKLRRSEVRQAYLNGRLSQARESAVCARSLPFTSNASWAVAKPCAHTGLELPTSA